MVISKMKSSFLVSVVLLLSLTLVGFTHHALADSAPAFAGGNGTVDQPFEIASAEQLNRVRNHLNAHFVMIADVDLAAYQSGEGWEPIGAFSSQFKGVFDGSGYAITGLKMDRPSTHYVGLFGYIGDGSVIKNVNLVDVDVTGNEYVGGVSGGNDKGSIIHSSVTGDVSGGSRRTGGLVGYVYKGSIIDSYSEANITGTNQVGGLAGYIEGTIRDSYATGSVTGYEHVGGIVGLSHPSSSIENSASFGNVKGTYRYIGGLVGTNDGRISNSYATGSVEGVYHVGGLVGRNTDNRITNAYATGSVTGNGDSGGLVGSNGFSGRIFNSYYNQDTTVQADTGKGTGKTTVELHDEGTYSSWDMNTIWGMHAAKNGGYPYLRTIQKYIVYDGNGHTSGHAQIDSPFYRSGSMVRVFGNIGNLERSGHSFAGWNTQADGSGTNVIAGDTLVMSASDITLYAQWTMNSYTVTFDKNEGDTEADPASIVVSYGDTVSTLPTAPARTGYTFVGWNTERNGTGTIVDEHVVIHEDITVYAQWTMNSYTVTFDKNEGDTEADPAAIVVSYGDTVGTLPAAPARTGYTFVGWNTERSGTGSIFDEHAVIHEDITVYAQWEQKLSTPPPTTPPGLTPSPTPAPIDSEPADDEEVMPEEIESDADTDATTPIDSDTDAGAEEPQESTSNGNFIDIAGHWAEQSIEEAASIGIVTGYPDHTFRPKQLVTRAEFSVLLVHALQLQDRGVELTFSDADDIADWAKPAVAQAVRAGIISGYQDGSFRPHAFLTRAEMVFMAARALDLSIEADVTTNFADDDEIPAWAKGAIEAMRQLAYIQGKNNNRFDPATNTTRAEAVIIILKLVG